MFYEDEVHFKLTLTIIRAWFLAGTCPEIKSPTDRYKVSVFGALGKNGQLITCQNEVFDAMSFQKFLQKLIAEAQVENNKNGKRKKILLILDNAKYHHAKILKPWLEEVGDILELFFLPPYSPDLNAIEMMWRKTRRNVTHNRYFACIDDLKYDINRYWAQFENPNDELTKLTKLTANI